MIKRDVQAQLDALASEEALLRHAGAVADAYGIDPANEVATAAKKMRDARLKAIPVERAALAAAEPASAPPASLSAVVLVQRTRVSVHGVLHLQLLIENEAEDAIQIASATVHATPGTTVTLPADLVSGHAAVPVIPALAELVMPFSVTFLAPGAYSVGANVRFTDGTSIEAEPADITVIPIA